MRVLLVALLTALAGCIVPAPPLGTDAADDARPFALADPVRVLGATTYEPGIAVAPDGTLYVAGYAYSLGTNGPGVLWKSVDNGATWEQVTLPSPRDGALGNSDVDVVVAPDGTVYYAAMLWLSLGIAVTVGASEDAGASWTWRILTVDAWADRPFLAVGADNVAHVVWNNARGVHHATSGDHGRTWTEGALVHPKGGTGRIAIGPNGELAVRIIQMSGPTFVAAGPVFVPFFVGNDPDADGVAISTDGGATWTFREVPGNRTPFDRLLQGGDGTFRWAEPVAFADGALVTAWTEEGRLHLARSRDLGASWEDAAVLDDADARAMFPTLAADGGRIGATWYTLHGDDVRANVATLSWARDGAPTAERVTFDVDWTAGEYFPLAFLADGRLVTATSYEEENDAGFEFRVELR